MIEIQDNSGRFLVVNGDLMDVAEKEEKDRRTLAFPFTGPVVYEVFRILQEKPLFLTDHYQRMKNSAELIGMTSILPEGALKEYTRILLQVNEQKDCNIKVLCIQCAGARADFIIYLSKTHYPAPECYDYGVATGLLPVQRPQPNAKIQRADYVARVDAFKQEKDVFEAILVNPDGRITEGSKSNLFFVEKNKVITAPSEMVLEGVMRKYVLEVCGRLEIPVCYRAVSTEELGQLDGAFLTGTSLKVLPVANIDSYLFPSAGNEIVLKIRKEFDTLIDGLQALKG